MKRLRIEQDVQPVSAFRANAAKLIEQVQSHKRALVLTQRGRSAAVVLDPAVFATCDLIVLLYGEFERRA